MFICTQKTKNPRSVRSNRKRPRNTTASQREYLCNVVHGEVEVFELFHVVQVLHLANYVVLEVENLEPPAVAAEGLVNGLQLFLSEVLERAQGKTKRACMCWGWGGQVLAFSRDPDHVIGLAQWTSYVRISYLTLNSKRYS